MQKKKIIGLMVPLTFSIACLAAYAKELTMDFGNGDAITISGTADNFDCEDPAFAHVTKRVHTWTLVFDNSIMSLCAPEGSPREKYIEPPQIVATSGDQESLVALYNVLPSEKATNPVLHAIGVYRAKKKEIVVNISDNSRPIVLSLSAYDSTHWRIRPEAGVIIQKIILSGYHMQQVSGMAATVPIETYTREPSICGQCVKGTIIPKVACSQCYPDYFYSFRQPAIQLKDVSGLDVTSFQGRYEESEFTISARLK